MSERSEAIKGAGKNLKWLGILTLVLGVVAFFTPLMTGISIVVMVGLFVMAGGVARMIWAFGSGSFGTGLLKFGIGILTLVCGIIMVSDPILASGMLTVLIAIYLLVDGGFEVAAAFSAPGGSGKGWMIFSGIISIVLGMMIWRQFPLSGAWAMGVFLGIKLITIGLGMMGVGRFVQKKA